jgi:hydroxymethylglutaryl-CoA lyase
MKIIECPRDAMQGLSDFIPTEKKVHYVNQLLKVGFDTIDFGSFVSPKAIPQMKDTAAVLDKLNTEESNSSLLAIVANTRGAEEASEFEKISYLGYPLSISETFQKRNTNKSIADALNSLVEIKNVCAKKNKKLVTYISMGFGNPYNDPYDPGMVSGFIDVLLTLGTDVISIADTIGAASPQDITSLMKPLLLQYKGLELGVHLHSSPVHSEPKIRAAVSAGCARIDGALKGFGGCPMANDELVGNIATEQIISILKEEGVPSGIDEAELSLALQAASEIFPKH